jgi:hypothetical protein
MENQEFENFIQRLTNQGKIVNDNYVNKKFVSPVKLGFSPQISFEEYSVPELPEVEDDKYKKATIPHLDHHIRHWFSYIEEHINTNPTLKIPKFKVLKTHKSRMFKELETPGLQYLNPIKRDDWFLPIPKPTGRHMPRQSSNLLELNHKIKLSAVKAAEKESGNSLKPMFAGNDGKTFPSVHVEPEIFEESAAKLPKTNFKPTRVLEGEFKPDYISPPVDLNINNISFGENAHIEYIFGYATDKSSISSVAGEPSEFSFNPELLKKKRDFSKDL